MAPEYGRFDQIITHPDQDKEPNGRVDGFEVLDMGLQGRDGRRIGLENGKIHQEMVKIINRIEE